MQVRLLAALLALGSAGPAIAQSGSAANRASFGPDRANGAFINITRQHLATLNAQGIAVDREQRVLVMNEWRDEVSTNYDCAVTRHIRNARLLDMDYTGPDELEATRRVAMDMGGSDIDLCTAIDVDASNRAVIAGWGDTGSGLSGFLVRLTASGAYDTSFSSDGKLALRNVAPFVGVQTRLNHVVAAGSNLLACGWVERGASRNMLVVRFTASGQLDTTFRGTGYAEVDFNVAGERDDSCSRLLVLPNGGILAGGVVTDASGNEAYGLARFSSTGGFVTAFGNQGRLLIDDGSQIVAFPALSDLAWDAARDRVLIGCTLTTASTPNGCLIAVNGNTGAFDTSFDGDGRLGFRFSNYGIVLGEPIREPGGTRVTRLLMRDDGSFYVLGTHYNSASDALANGPSDIASLRLTASGAALTSGANEYGNNGVRFHTFDEVDQSGVGAAGRRVGEVLVDAGWYQGSPLLLADRPRYPENVFDHDGDGNLAEPGPIVPLVAAITGEHLFGADFDFDGLDRSTGLQPIIPTPAGFGHYCSVRSPTNPAIYGVLPGGAGSDPCQQFLDENPALIVERSGLYSLSGLNWVIGTCNGNFITLRPGNGAAPINTAFADSAGQSGCIFTVTPDEMPIFARPYSGAHLSGAANWTQAFNHDPYFIPLDVSEFGQSPGQFDACAIDNYGRQRSTGNPATGNCTVTGGVDEPAADIAVLRPRLVQAVAAGRVVMAVPRHIPPFAPPGMDPYQREVFVRHQVGLGRYAEIFTTYSAHMQDTAVRRGQTVSAGTVLGAVGTTGASSGDHLHLSVHRHRNLSWRSSYEFNFSGGAHDRDGSVSAIDPWGWQAPQGVDPWAWRFRDNPGTARDNAGSFSTRLWINGEEPPLPVP